MTYILVPIKQLKDPKVPDFSTMVTSELLEHYDKARDWLQKHASQPLTQNLFDVQGDTYEPDQYEAALKLLEMIEDEGKKRQLVAFLTEDEIKAAFSS